MSSSSTRQALYSTATHRAMRWAWGSFLALFLFGMIEVAAKVISKAVGTADGRGLSGLWALAPVLLVWLGLASFFFRQQPIWGSADGLEVGRGRRSRLIPWSKVSPPEWAWFSFDAPGSLRIAYVEITDEGRIFIYADDDSLEKLSLLRNDALASRRTKATAIENDAVRADRLHPHFRRNIYCHGKRRRRSAFFYTPFLLRLLQSFDFPKPPLALPSLLAPFPLPLLNVFPLGLSVSAQIDGTWGENVDGRPADATHAAPDHAFPFPYAQSGAVLVSRRGGTRPSIFAPEAMSIDLHARAQRLSIRRSSG